MLICPQRLGTGAREADNPLQARGDAQMAAGFQGRLELAGVPAGALGAAGLFVG